MRKQSLGLSQFFFGSGWFLLATVVLTSRLLAAPPQIGLSGTVVDSQGKPVDDAELFYEPSRGTAEIPPVRSGAEGRFRFLVPDPAGCAEDKRLGVLWAYSPHHLATRVHLEDAKGPLSALRVVLGPPGDFRLQVLDPQENPLAGAALAVTTVYIDRKSFFDPTACDPTDRHLTLFKATTDKEGKAAIPMLMLDWVYGFEISHPDFGRQSVSAGKQCQWLREHPLRLYPVGRVSGRVIADNPDLFRDVKVNLESEAGSYSDNRPEATST